MARLFDLVDQRNGVVLIGNPAATAGIAQRRVGPESENAGTLSDDELCRRREKRPVEISCLAQGLEEHAACPRFRLVWFRYAARIDQLDALAVIKTARTANHDVARHARSAH